MPVKNKQGKIIAQIIVWGDKYLVFLPTGNNEWHAQNRPWKGVKNEGVDDPMREALKKAGITSFRKSVI